MIRRWRKIVTWVWLPASGRTVMWGLVLKKVVSEVWCVVIGNLELVSLSLSLKRMGNPAVTGRCSRLFFTWRWWKVHMKAVPRISWGSRPHQMTFSRLSNIRLLEYMNIPSLCFWNYWNVRIYYHSASGITGIYEYTVILLLELLECMNFLSFCFWNCWNIWACCRSVSGINGI